MSNRLRSVLFAAPLALAAVVADMLAASRLLRSAVFYACVLGFPVQKALRRVLRLPLPPSQLLQQRILSAPFQGTL